jgi:monoamine oxidase
MRCRSDSFHPLSPLLLSLWLIVSLTDTRVMAASDAATEVNRVRAEASDYVILGAGLAGASASYFLRQKHPDASILILEARDRTGGRLLTKTIGEGGVADLGGAWIWPGQEVVALAARLGVSTIRQEGPYSDQRLRVVGGAALLVDTLLEKAGAEVVLGAEVVSVRQEQGDEVCISTAGGSEYAASKGVVVALPPRLAGHSIQFDPPLPSPVESALSDATTWMAATAKAAFQELPQQLRGAVSEVYGSAGISVAFVFGDESQDRVEAEAEDAFCNWSKERYTSGTEGAKAMGFGHPRPGPSALREVVTQGRSTPVVFAGAETDQVSPGLMDGAVRSGRRAARAV